MFSEVVAGGEEERGGCDDVSEEVVEFAVVKVGED